MSTEARVWVYDTTLRDGTQGEGLSFSAKDKVRVAKRLDALGVSYIEGGWPGSNPKDVEFFERVRDCDFETAVVCAFGSTRRKGVAPEDDAGLRTLLKADTEVCTIFGKSWMLQVEEVLQTSAEENLAMIEDSVRFLREQGRRVFYDAEHFFDGYVADREYALACLLAAERGGAETVVLCETNGGRLPWEVEEACLAARSVLQRATGFGIHAHDDSGLAVANSLVAVRAGATQVQGTINGYGERCGNANLCTVLPDLSLKMGIETVPSTSLGELVELSHFVAELANLGANSQWPFVGRSAFAHKGGVHVSAMRRTPHSYQHVEPERVGNTSRVLVSELSGRGTLLSKADDAGLSVDASTASYLVDAIKEAEHRGACFEAAEASVTLLMRRRREEYTPPFRVLDYKVLSVRRDDAEAPSTTSSEAIVRLDVEGHEVHVAAAGDGPVESLDKALRKALKDTYPQLSNMHLVDYKVRILDGSDATQAVTRVLIDSTDGSGEAWSTVGASRSIIDASCQALLDSFEFALTCTARASTAGGQASGASAACQS